MTRLEVVSILTHLLRRMQPRCPCRRGVSGRRFNPHPPLEADATPLTCRGSRQGQSFNPHPPLEADATRRARVRRAREVSILTHLLRRMQPRCASCSTRATSSFNPHPPLEADATCPAARGRRCSRSFNPHPPLEADATPAPAATSSCRHPVSILTHLLRRMQPGSRAPCPRSRSFNPHPPLEADATPGFRSRHLRSRSFNPHPPLEADATSVPMGHHRHRNSKFQSSPTS